MRKMLAEITHNMRIKTYPDGSKTVYVSSLPIYRETGWELSDKWEHESKSAARSVGQNNARSKRRAVSRLRDYGRSNDFKFFVTLTLDSSIVDRYDISAVMRKMNTWLDNRVRRNGLKYVLVPEYHKDGAIHFHGFMNDALSVVSSGTFSSGSGRPRKPRSNRQLEQWRADGWHEVFNLPGWSFGFSTAIELYGDRRAAVNYVCKYITKNHEKIGGRWYYSGGDLRLPSVELFDVDFDDFRDSDDVSYRFTIDGLGVDVVCLEIEGDIFGHH